MEKSGVGIVYGSVGGCAVWRLRKTGAGKNPCGVFERSHFDGNTVFDGGVGAGADGVRL